MRGRAAKAIAALGGGLVGAVLFMNCSRPNDTVPDEFRCTLIGCVSGAVITAQLPVGAQSLGGAMFSLCLNGICSTGVLPAGSNNGLRELSLEGSLYQQKVELLDDSDGGVAARFSFQGDEIQLDGAVVQALDGGAAMQPLHDGDVYVVTIIAANGTTLGRIETAVTYSTFQPNGPRCDPICYSAHYP